MSSHRLLELHDADELPEDDEIEHEDGLLEQADLDPSQLA